MWQYKSASTAKDIAAASTNLFACCKLLKLQPENYNDNILLSTAPKKLLTEYRPCTRTEEHGKEQGRTCTFKGNIEIKYSLTKYRLNNYRAQDRSFHK